MFAEGNIGAIEGTELLNALGLDGWEIQKPDVWSKYLEIAKYFEKFTDGANIARLVARSSPKGEKINKVLEYMNLRKQLDAVREQRAGINPPAASAPGFAPGPVVPWRRPHGWACPCLRAPARRHGRWPRRRSR